MEPTPPALEGEVLTTRQPGKSREKAVLNWEQACPQGTLDSVWRHSGLSQVGGAVGSWWVEARDAADHFTMHRTALPPYKELSSPQINSAKVEQLKPEGMDVLSRERSTCKDVEMWNHRASLGRAGRAGANRQLKERWASARRAYWGQPEHLSPEPEA